MPDHIIKYIWKHSSLKQLCLILLTFVSFPLLYYTLEVPKLIINGVLTGQSGVSVFLGWHLEPFTFLLVLSFAFLGLVLANGLLKICINTFKGKVGESLIQRLRYLLVQRLLQFPLKQFKHMPAGEVSITIVQETDPLAGFVSESFALPVFQSGTLITVLIFMFVQDWILGLASLILVPVQLIFIPRLQRQINTLRKERIQKVRSLSSRLVETVNAVEEVQIQGTQRYTLAEFSYRFRTLYEVRLAIFKKKFFMKFLNNFLGHITPFLFYVVGGYLVLEGRLTLGALVAAIAAHKDFLSPWKELLNYYQSYQDNVIRYQNIISQFYSDDLNYAHRPPGLTADARLEKSLSDSEVDALFSHPLRLDGVGFYNDAGETLIQNIDLSIARGDRLAIIAQDNLEAQTFARILSALQLPSQGDITLGEHSMTKLPKSKVRQNIGLVTAHPHLFNAALSYNLGYGLNHVPPTVENDKQPKLEAAIKAGTSPDWFDETFDCVWTDLARLGAKEWHEAIIWLYEQMQVVNAGEQMVHIALREVFNPDDYEEAVFGNFPEKLIAVRPLLWQRLQAEKCLHYFEPLRPDCFLRQASLEKNLIYGTCLQQDHHTREVLLTHIKSALVAQAIFDESCVIAAVALQQLLDEYRHASLTQHRLNTFNLSDTNEINRLQRLNQHLKINFTKQKRKYRAYPDELLDIFLKIVPAEWSSIEFSLSFREAIVVARRGLQKKLKGSKNLAYYAFDAQQYNPGLSVMHNLLFGHVDQSQAMAFEKLQLHINQLVQEQQLEANMLQLMIINNQAGVGGHGVSEPMRHKLNLARTLLKKPAVLILHSALLPLNYEEQAKILDNIKRSRPDMSIVWIGSEAQHARYFDTVYRLDKTLFINRSNPRATLLRYPERQISLLVAYHAGGGTDYQARIITMLAAAIDERSQKKYLEQPLVIVNHPGRAGRDGWNHFVEHSKADGYELAVYNLPHMIAQAAKYSDKVKYTLDTFEPLLNWGADPAVFVVSRASPFYSMADVIKFVKKHPARFTLSGAGLYTGHHLAALQLDKATGVKSRYVSGDGGDNALRMVKRRQVLGGFNNLSDAYRNQNELRTLAIADTARSQVFFPNVPTFTEQGIRVDDSSVNLRGIMAPKGLPEHQLMYLTERIHAMLADEMATTKMRQAGAGLHIMQRDEVKALWFQRQKLIAELVS